MNSSTEFFILNPLYRSTHSFILNLPCILVLSSSHWILHVYMNLIFHTESFLDRSTESWILNPSWIEELSPKYYIFYVKKYLFLYTESFMYRKHWVLHAESFTYGGTKSATSFRLVLKSLSQQKEDKVDLDHSTTHREAPTTIATTSLETVDGNDWSRARRVTTTTTTTDSVPGSKDQRSNGQCALAAVLRRGNMEIAWLKGARNTDSHTPLRSIDVEHIVSEIWGFVGGNGSIRTNRGNDKDEEGSFANQS